MMMRQNQKQQRTIFSFLPSSTDNKTDDDDTDGDGGKKTDISMPPRNTDDTNLLNQQHQENQVLRQNFNRVRNEVFELLESPAGSFPWSQLSPLLRDLCEYETTIHRAFELLDRASLEPTAKTRITHEMVDRVVRHWLKGYIVQQKSIDKPHSKSYYSRSSKRTTRNSKNNGNGDRDMNMNMNMNMHNNRKKKSNRMMTPSKVWDKIKNYQQIGIPLESTTYHKVMEGTGHAKLRLYNLPDGPRLAETILEEIMAQSKRKNLLVRPSAHAFTLAIQSWKHAAIYSPAAANREAPQRALALLNKLKSLYASGWGNEFMPNKSAYRRVMNLFAHTGDGDQVEALLEDMYTMYLDHDEQGHENTSFLMPTSPFFSLVLYAWSKSRDPDAAERAEAILDRMLEMERTNEIPNLVIESNFFNLAMVCWSKQRTMESATRAQAIFDRLVEYSKSDPTKVPVGATYLVLITTWSRFDPEKSEKLFLKWKEEHENGTCEMRIDSDLIRMLVSSWCRSEEPDATERSERLIQHSIREPGWKLSRGVFHIVINKLCHQKTLDGLERAEDLLRQMIAYHERNPGSDARPTHLSYLPIIRSWAEIGQIEKAEELLVEYFTQWRGSINATGDSNNVSSLDSSRSIGSEMDQRYDTQIFNCVLKGWRSKASTMPEAVVRAEDILLLTKSYGVKPNYASFRYVLDAWRNNSLKQGRPRADAVLALLDQEYNRRDTRNELYLKLRRKWKLLSVN